MGIGYLWCKEFEAAELEDLFLSVEWSSGRYPKELKKAMAGSHAVLSAWDGERLVGLMNSLSDGAMTAYFHYLLVRPEYQGQGIGRELITRMLQHYDGYLCNVLNAYDAKVGFYKKCGFVVSEGLTPMLVTKLAV